MNHVIVLSGGLDSTVALALQQQSTRLSPDAVPSVAVGFDYGQTHVKELVAAQAVADHYGIPYEVVNLDGMFHGSALLGDGTIPHAGYDEDSMASTVVHGRNLLFASLAIARAGEWGSVTLGVHAGDHHIYPDCRPVFWEQVRSMANLTYNTRVVTPLLHKTKAQAVNLGTILGAPLALTWSCYEGHDIHCGRCGTCVERRGAFVEAGVADPTQYAC